MNKIQALIYDGMTTCLMSRSLYPPFCLSQCGFDVQEVVDFHVPLPILASASYPCGVTVIP